MDIERLKARVYMLAGQLEEAKKILNEAVEEYNAYLKKQEEAKKNVDPEKQPEPATDPKPETTNQ